MCSTTLQRVACARVEVREAGRSVEGGEWAGKGRGRGGEEVGGTKESGKEEGT
jgi:hypothetical protein